MAFNPTSGPGRPINLGAVNQGLVGQQLMDTVNHNPRLFGLTRLDNGMFTLSRGYPLGQMGGPPPTTSPQMGDPTQGYTMDDIETLDPERKAQLFQMLGSALGAMSGRGF